MKRSRGRNRRSGGSNQNNFSNPNRHYESVGPDVKIRGSAQQVLEKYQQYARDAYTSGDRILSEAYFQFAEHYQRIVAKQQETRQPPPFQGRPGGRDERDNRPGQDRDNRNGPHEDGGQREDEQSEATVTRSVPIEPVHEAPEAMRVIDADDDDETEIAQAETRPAAKPADDGDRSRARRKPYKPREDREPRLAASDPPAEIDGIMKTLSRGRRKASPAEGTEDAGAPAETTD